MTTRASGRTASSRRVASMPSMPGIDTSMSTTSGCSASATLDRLLAVADGVDHLDVGLLAEELAQPAPHQGVVVDDEQADPRGHQQGTSTATCVPLPGLRLDVQRAARVGDQVAQQAEADVAVAAAALEVAGAEAAAVVVDLQAHVVAAVVQAHRRRGWRRRACRRCAAPPGRRGTAASSWPPTARCRAGASRLMATPLPASGSSRSRSALSMPSAWRLGGAISTMSVRRSRIAARVSPGGVLDVGHVGRGRGGRAVRRQPPRQRAEREGHRRQPLHDPVVEVAGDAPALLLGRVDGPLEQHLALGQRGAQAPRHADGERDLHDEEDAPGRPSSTGRKDDHTDCWYWVIAS